MAVQLCQTGGELLCARCQLIDAGDQLLGLFQKRAQAVIELRRAVEKLTHAVRQIVQGILQTVGGVELIGIDLIENLICCDGHGVHHGEVLHIGGNLHIARDFQRFRIKTEAFLHARQGDAGDDIAAAVVEQLAVGDLHIAEGVRVEKHAGQHGEGDVDLFLLAVDGHGLVLLVFVVIADHNVAGLARQLLGRDGLAVKRVADLQGHGQLLFDVALIIDVVSGCVPNAGVRGIHGVGLVALDVLDVGQLTGIGQRCAGQRVFDPIADDDLLHGAVRSGQNVDGLVLLGRGGLLVCRQRHGRLALRLRLLLHRAAGINRRADAACTYRSAQNQCQRL